MPEGYYFVNESTLWQPIMVSYALLIAGSAVLIFALLAYLMGKMKKLIPVSVLIGASMFFVVLLGPLGDLMSPSRAIEILLHPHVFSTPISPGFSLIAFYGGVLWPLGSLLILVFGLLYFSYPLHQKAERSQGWTVGIMKILSLGVKSKERYEALQKLNRIIAVILIIIMIPWLFYPALLFLVQTSTFIWTQWYLLPIQNMVENFLIAFSLIMLAYTIHFYEKLDGELLGDLNRIIIIVSLSLIVIIGLQVAIWAIKFGGSYYYESVSVVLPLLAITGLLALITIIVSLVAIKTTKLGLLTGLLGILTVVISKWNTVILGQTTSKTGLAILEVEFHTAWFLSFLAPIALGILLYIIFTYIFPLEVDVNE